MVNIIMAIIDIAIAENNSYNDLFNKALHWMMSLSWEPYAIYMTF